MRGYPVRKLIDWNHERANEAFARGARADSAEGKAANIGAGNYHRATAQTLEKIYAARDILKDD